MTYKKSFVLGTGGDIIEFTGLNDLSIDLQFLLGTSQDQFFDRVGRDKPQDPDFLLLTNSMSTDKLAPAIYNGTESDIPILGLQICVRIPIGIIAGIHVSSSLSQGDDSLHDDSIG